MTGWAAWVWAAAATAWPLAATAQSVSLAGQMGGRALLVIDGQSQMLSVGDTARGVRLVRMQGDTVSVERDGVASSLRVGGAPVRLGTGGSTAGAAREVVIPAGPGGHFITAGSINGRAAQFLVDTGATLVSMGQPDADRLGLDWRGGQRVTTHTANGAAPAVLVTLARVRVGGVELNNVGAVVMPTAMPVVLLGNSFLSRLQMRRDNDVMRLEVRP